MSFISLVSLLRLLIHIHVPPVRCASRLVCDMFQSPLCHRLWYSNTARIGNPPFITLRRPRAHRSSCYPPLLPVAKLIYTALPESDATTTEPPSLPFLPFPSPITQSRNRKLCRVRSPPHSPRTLVRVDMSIRTFPGFLPHHRSRIPSLIRTKTSPPMR